MNKSTAPGVISHWYNLAENFQTSTQDFYAAVEQAVDDRKVPDVTVSRVEWQEGGIGSAKREYLRIQRKTIAFDICAAPYGEKSYFFSWWMARVPGANAFVGLFILFTMLWVLGFFAFIVQGMLGSTCGSMLISAIAVPVVIFVLGKAVQDGVISSEDEVLSIPYLGAIYAFLFNPHAYYRHDTALMFQESIKNAVMEVVNEVRTEQGLRALTDQEMMPKLRDLAS